jgi:hypothetical protein
MLLAWGEPRLPNMEETMTTGKVYPLANDVNGNPIEVPQHAVGWRVMRRSGRQGRPQCVYDPATGAQLVLPIDANIDSLRDYGPGVYKLYAVDRDGKAIDGVVAQTEVPFERPDEDSDEPYGSKSESAALIRHLVDANVRVMEAMASAFGKVRPMAVEPLTVEMPSSVNGQPADQGAQIMQLLGLLPDLLKGAKGIWEKAKASADVEDAAEGSATNG